MESVSRRAAHDGNDAARAAMAMIWQHQREDVLARVGTLEDAVAALRRGFLPEAQRRAAEQDAHRLAGAAGTFAFHRASESAHRLERIFAGSEPVPAEEAITAADEVMALRAALDGKEVPAPTGTGSSGPETAGIDDSAVGSTRPTALVHTADVVVLAAVRTVLERVGVSVVELQDPARLRTALAESCPDVVIVDLDTAGLQWHQRGRTVGGDLCGPEIPVLFLAARDDVDLAAADVLAKPFTAPELLDRVCGRLGPPRSRPPGPNSGD